jgi:hypothetical protein
MIFHIFALLFSLAECSYRNVYQLRDIVDPTINIENGGFYFFTTYLDA